MGKCKVPYVIDDAGKPGQGWNVVRGCKRKSPGCHECYAERLAATRLNYEGSKYEGLAKMRPLPRSRGPRGGSSKNQRPEWTGKVNLCPKELDKPLQRRKLTTWFLDMGDLFYEEVPDGYILRVFRVMAQARLQRFLILTKRPERLADWLAKWADAVTGETWDFKGVSGPEAVRKAHPSPRGQMFASYLETLGEPPPGCAYPTFDWLEGMRSWPASWYLPNVWFGVSVESRKYLDRVATLLRCDGGRAAPGGVDCAGFWLSAEPQLGDLGDISEYLEPAIDSAFSPGCEMPLAKPEDRIEPRPGLSWIVQGSEQLAGGRNGRRFDPAWVISMHEQIQAAITPADVPGQSHVTAWPRDTGPRLHYFYKQAPGPGGKVDKLPELYGRTWRQVPWIA